MSTTRPYGNLSARAAWGCIGSRVERTCSECGKGFMMDAGCHVYRTDFGVQCSWSCFKRAKSGEKRKHERKPRAQTVRETSAMRAQCLAQLEENRRALERTHGKERDRINARISYWRRKLADIDRDAACIEAAKREE